MKYGNVFLPLIYPYFMYATHILRTTFCNSVSVFNSPVAFAFLEVIGRTSAHVGVYYKTSLNIYGERRNINLFASLRMEHIPLQCTLGQGSA